MAKREELLQELMELLVPTGWIPPGLNTHMQCPYCQGPMLWNSEKLRYVCHGKCQEVRRGVLQLEL